MTTTELIGVQTHPDYLTRDIDAYITSETMFLFCSSCLRTIANYGLTIRKDIVENMAYAHMLSHEFEGYPEEVKNEQTN